MNQIINESKSFIQEQINTKQNPLLLSYNKISKVYAFTNENIYGYMSKLDFANKGNALSVMASGDHPFNLALYGINNIDTFDINALTEYYALGIKRSAILAFDYLNYIAFMNKLLDKFLSLNELNDLINQITPYMETKHRIYWKSLIDYYHILQKESNISTNLFHLFLLDPNKIDGYMVNTYLKSEKNYNKLRNIIGKTNINFEQCDFNNITNTFNNQYDFIILSNILDYLYINLGSGWKYDKLKHLEDSLTPLLKENGIIALDYIYNYFNALECEYKKNIINFSDITHNDLTTEKIITFQNVFVNKIIHNSEAAILIKHK